MVRSSAGIEKLRADGMEQGSRGDSRDWSSLIIPPSLMYGLS